MFFSCDFVFRGCKNIYCSFLQFIPAGFAADDCTSRRLDSYYFCQFVFHAIQFSLYRFIEIMAVAVPEN